MPELLHALQHSCLNQSNAAAFRQQSYSLHALICNFMQAIATVLAEALATASPSGADSQSTSSGTSTQDGFSNSFGTIHTTTSFGRR